MALDILKRIFFLTDSCSTGYGIPDQEAVDDCSCTNCYTVILESSWLLFACIANT